MAAIRWHRHWTDYRDDPLQPRKLRRVLDNWSNYKTPGGIWTASAPGIAASQGTPPDWVGQYDFDHDSSSAPLQCFFRDATDAGNRAMVGMRLADAPGSWVNIKAHDIDNAVDVSMEGTTRATWPGLWTNSDLCFTHTRHKLIKEIVLSTAGHPASFTFTMKMPASHTLSVANDAGEIRNAAGDVVFNLRQPWGVDSAAAEPEANYIRCTMAQGADIAGMPSITITPNADDLAGATYPVTIDPTATIGGGAGDTDKIEDTTLVSGATSDRNYGGYTQVFTRDIYTGLVRISDITQIPDGIVDDFRFYATSSQATVGDVISIYAVKDANDWVEGTAVGANQAGSCSWDDQIDPSTPWAGGASGCQTSGTDYDADASPPAYATVASNNEFNVSLVGQWASDWRDGNRDSNGMCMISNTNSTTGFKSTESAGAYPRFEVDYTEASASGALYVATILGTTST